MDNENRKERPATEAAAGPPQLPDRIGTPGLTGLVDEGGRRVRAGVSAEEGALLPPEQQGAPGSSDRAARAKAGSLAPPTVGLAGAPPPPADEPQTVRLHAEELQPRTQRVQTEEVILHKRVVTERRHIEVEVRREELVVERRPGGEHQVGGAGTNAAPLAANERLLGEGETVTILLREEAVRLEKVPVVIEEVRISRRRVTERRPVTAALKREVLHVEETAPDSAEAGQRQGHATGREA